MAVKRPAMEISMDDTFELSVRPGTDLTEDERGAVLLLFDQSYARANHEYLLKAFDVMRFIALAYDGEALAGFAVGDARQEILPRMSEPTVVAMAGIACIDGSYRRSGLFGKLALASIMESGLLDDNPRHLFCGRMAHAASYRAMVRASSDTIPQAGQPLSEWQMEVTEFVAGLYGSKVDRETSRVIGKGEPIGYPVVDIEATRDEEEVFASVNRDQGDSILAISWRPDAPAEWLTRD